MPPPRKFTAFSRTFFVRPTDVGLESLVRKFWETDGYDQLATELPLSLEDQRIITNAESSCRFVDGRHEIAVRWKRDRRTLPEELPNTFDTALRRLKNLEKNLQKDISLKRTTT